MKQKAQEVFSKKVSRILLLAFFDVLSVILASLLTLWIRFDFREIPVDFLHTVIYYLPIDCLVVVAGFSIIGLYTSIWRYASVPELISVIVACLASDLLIFVYKHALLLPIPRSFWFVFPAFLIFFTCGVRYSYRIMRAILNAASNHSAVNNIMLIGGGEAARMLIDEMCRNEDYKGSRVACIIDDDKSKAGSRIHGVKVIGGRRMIGTAVEKYQINLFQR